MLYASCKSRFLPAQAGSEMTRWLGIAARLMGSGVASLVTPCIS
jgi:hypothetical protein